MHMFSPPHQKSCLHPWHATEYSNEVKVGPTLLFGATRTWRWRWMRSEMRVVGALYDSTASCLLFMVLKRGIMNRLVQICLPRSCSLLTRLAAMSHPTTFVLCPFVCLSSLSLCSLFVSHFLNVTNHGGHIWQWCRVVWFGGSGSRHWS